MESTESIKSNFIIDLLMYPHKVMVSINESDAELLKALKKGKIKKGTDISELINLPENHIGLCVILSSKFVVIRIKATSDVNKNIRIATHEIFHATTLILDFIGVQFEIGKSDEQYAYLMNYLAGLILPRFLG